MNFRYTHINTLHLHPNKKIYYEKDDYLRERKQTLNGFENVVENGIFAQYEQMIHFKQYFFKGDLTIVL